MGTALTGQTVASSYDALLKVTDNGPIGGTLKTVTDGLGNDTALQLSSAGVKSLGTLAADGAASFPICTAIGSTTPGTGAFTSLSATAGLNANSIGAGTPGTGVFTTLSANAGISNTGGQVTQTATVAAGSYGMQVLGAAGADRDVLLAGVSGVSNGLTVQSVSGDMVYTFGLASGNVMVANSSGITVTGTATLGTANVTTLGATTANITTLNATTLTASGGSITAAKVLGGGSAPGIAAGAAAGTGPTISITGTDTAGRIAITLGTSPGTNGVLATITFAAAFAAAPYVSLTPSCSAAASTYGLHYVTSSTTSFVINYTSPAQAGGTQIDFFYHVIG